MQEPGIAFAKEPDPAVRWRAWRMWLATGSHSGREDEFLRRARELQAADDNPATSRLPNTVHIVDDSHGFDGRPVVGQVDHHFQPFNPG